MEFEHQAMDLTKKRNSVYTAMSKRSFYFKEHISKFVLEQDKVPLNPFMIFSYFLIDTIDRDKVREANNNLVKMADEIWTFGPISDGVLAEILLAKKTNKPVRYFKIEKSKGIKEISKDELEFEDNLEKHKNEL